MPTGIWSSRWRSGCAHWDLDCEEEAAGEEAEEEEEEEKSSVKNLANPSPGQVGKIQWPMALKAPLN